MLNLSSVNSINNNQYSYGVTKSNSVNSTTAINSNPISLIKSEKNVSRNWPSFSALINKNGLRTSLSGKTEHDKYNTVVTMLDKKTRNDLQELLKTGKLLDNSANDNSTTLDNLYKILF